MKPPLTGHLRDLSKCPLNSQFCKSCAIFVNDLKFQQLLCTVIKFHVVKEAKEAVLYFVRDFRSCIYSL